MSCQNKKNTQETWKNSIQVLKNYCAARSWEVEISKKKVDEAIPSESKIILNKNHKPEILFYFFLHELGHMLMVLDDENYSKKYKSLDDKTTWSQTFRVLRVEEEMEAWNKGLELADNLHLEIDHNKYEELKASMVSSYMIWAIIRKHPHNSFSKRKPQIVNPQED